MNALRIENCSPQNALPLTQINTETFVRRLRTVSGEGSVDFLFFCGLVYSAAASAVKLADF